jgi:hypothetical protein
MPVISPIGRHPVYVAKVHVELQHHDLRVRVPSAGAVDLVPKVGIPIDIADAAKRSVALPAAVRTRVDPTAVAT